MKPIHKTISAPNRESPAGPRVVDGVQNVEILAVFLQNPQTLPIAARCVDLCLMATMSHVFIQQAYDFLCELIFPGKHVILKLEV